jgi:hypothetical protein
MKEFYQAVLEILEANTGAGFQLEGVAVLKNEFAGMKPSCVVVRRVSENVIGQNAQYKQVEGVIELNAFIQINKRDSAAEHRETQEEAAEELANKVEKVLLTDGRLISASFAEGITRHPEKTQMRNRAFGEFQHQDGEFVFVRTELSAHYVYRDMVLSLS